MSSKSDIRGELESVLVRHGHSLRLSGDLNVALVDDLEVAARRFAAEERAARTSDGSHMFVMPANLGEPGLYEMRFSSGEVTSVRMVKPGD